MAAASWEDVTPATLVNCFKKAGFLMQDDDEQDDFDDHPDDDNTAAMLEAWDTVGLEGVTLDDYISADDNVVVTGVPTDDDIVASVQSTDSTSQLHPQDEFDDDVDNCGEEFVPPTAEEAQYAIYILQAYFSSKNVDAVVFHKLTDITRTLTHTIATSKTQKKLTDFFNTV